LAKRFCESCFYRGDENEFRISINLLGIGQTGTSARAGF